MSELDLDIRKNWIKIKDGDREYNRRLRRAFDQNPKGEKRRLSYKPGMELEGDNDYENNYNSEVTEKLESFLNSNKS